MRDNWQLWQSQLQSCQGCDLCRTRTHVVCGCGSRDAQIMLLGEAPGRQEDASGQPFCGAAGAKLESFLQQIELDRNDIYIGNVVKCRPVRPAASGQGYANRRPSKQEILACGSWLKREIALLHPHLIITLGAVPLSVFLGKEPVMADWHGRPFQVDGSDMLVFPLYHPAAVIYDRKKEKDYETDLQVLRQFLQKKGIWGNEI